MAHLFLAVEKTSIGLRYVYLAADDIEAGNELAEVYAKRKGINWDYISLVPGISPASIGLRVGDIKEWPVG
jgi:hypothetical protein